MNQLMFVAVLACLVVGRNESAASGIAHQSNSAMTQLAHSTDALRSALRRAYPAWSPEADAQRMTVRRLIGETMDYREISRRALGHTWDQLSDGDRDEFAADLATLIERRCLSGETSLSPGDRLTFQREVISDDGTASVYAVLVTRSNEKTARIALEYRLVWKSGRWMVYDLVTDGDSLLDNYRAQFDRIIRRESFAGLKRRIKRAELRYDAP